MNAKGFLTEQLFREFEEYFGVRDRVYIMESVEAWMKDYSNSKHRFDSLESVMLRPKRVLDMAAGCGTCVFYGLLNGYDMYGIDPEEWKFKFNRMKADENDYDPAWKARFYKGVGEALPFEDNFFDAVTSYQTLEHVQDPYKVLQEMIRVTRPGGGIHIQCPDYRSTFEGHYRLPWLPLFPRPLAKMYLQLMNRPTKGLDTLQYITLPKINAWLRRIHREQSTRISVVDVKRSHSRYGVLYPIAILREHINNLFRQEMQLDIFIHVLHKQTARPVAYHPDAIQFDALQSRTPIGTTDEESLPVIKK